ncbi:MAG TPA: STAS domain-containing protein [Thermoleophilaceae bacterium]|nr:STAS domain-containing protein [Thermoleophilaceae bacterium]
MSSPAWQPFSVTVATDGDRAVVSFRGELDMSGVDRARTAIEQAESGTATLLVLDLSELDFIDSTGLEVVLRAARRAHDDGRRLIVQRPSRYVRRLLEMTAIDQSLDVVEDVV